MTLRSLILNRKLRLGSSRKLVLSWILINHGFNRGRSCSDLLWSFEVLLHQLIVLLSDLVKHLLLLSQSVLQLRDSLSVVVSLLGDDPDLVLLALDHLVFLLHLHNQSLNLVLGVLFVSVALLSESLQLVSKSEDFSFKIAVLFKQLVVF